jgi:hypothetical protein
LERIVRMKGFVRMKLVLWELQIPRSQPIAHKNTRWLRLVMTAFDGPPKGGRYKPVFPQQRKCLRSCTTARAKPARVGDPASRAGKKRRAT